MRLTQTSWVWPPFLPITKYVTLSKLLNFVLNLTHEGIERFLHV